MAEVLRIEVTDHRNDDEECWVHELPMDTEWDKIIDAVQTLYPSCSSLNISVTEESS